MSKERRPPKEGGDQWEFGIGRLKKLYRNRWSGSTKENKDPKTKKGKNTMFS